MVKIMTKTDVLKRIDTRVEFCSDSPIVKEIFMQAHLEIRNLRDKVEALEAEIQRLNQIAKYT